MTNTTIAEYKAMLKISKHERHFLECYKNYSIPDPVRELQFYEGRKWRFDFAFPDYKIAIELEGGIYCHGRHTRPGGYISDCEKYNAATLQGWRVYRFTHAVDALEFCYKHRADLWVK